MIKDLNAIYDGTEENAGPPLTPEQIQKAWDSAPSPYLGGQVSQRRPEEYVGYLKEGLSEAPGRNPELERGAAQGNWEKLGNGLAHTLVKSGTQLIDMAGGLQSLLFEWGDDLDYKNGFTQVADEINGWMDKHAPMYRSTEGTFGLGDLSWWMQNGSGLVSSMAGFAVGGAGIAKTLGALGKLGKVGAGVEWMAGVATQDARMAKLIANLGEEAVTAGTLAYSEGAMSGRRVFDEVYNTQLKLGTPEQEARHIAAESAATTVQLNTFVNTGFNMLGGMGAFFDHSSDNVLRVAKNNLKHTAGEEAQAFATRLKGLKSSDFSAELGTVRTWENVGKKLAVKGKESFAEGMEELTNQWAEKVGVEQGKKGEVKGFIDQLSALSDYADYTMNAEGGLNFLMGAIGGPLQHGALNYLPIHKVLDKTATDAQGTVIGADGKPVEDVTKDGAKVYKRMSAHSLANDHIASRFDYIKKELVDDVEWFARTQTALKNAQNSGNVLEVQRLKNELLNASQILSVKNGMGSNLAEMYKDIAKISNDISPKEEIIQKANTLVASIAEKQANGIDVAEDQAQLQQLQEQLKVASDKTAAQVLGVSSGKGDNAYVEKANKVVEQLAVMDKIRDSAFEKLGFASDSPHPEERGVADFLTDLGIRAYLTSERVKEMKAELAGLDNDILANYSTALDEAALAEKTYSDFMRSHDRLSRRAEKVNSLLEALKAAENSSDPIVLTEATDKLAQYGLSRMEHESNKDFSKRVLERLGKIKEKFEQDKLAYKEKILTTEGYEKWETKNPGKHFGNYIDHLRSISSENTYTKELADSIADTELANELITESFKSLSNAATLSKVLKNGANYFKRLEALQKKLEEDRTKEIKAGLANESNIRKDNRVKLEKLLNKSKQRLAELNEELDAAKALLAEIEELENKQGQSILEKGKMGIAKQMVLENITRLNSLINKELQQAKKIKDWMGDAVYVPPPPPPPPQPGAQPVSPFQVVLDEFTALIDEYKKEGSLTPELEAELNKLIDTYSFQFSEYAKAFKEVESLLPPGVEDKANELAENLKADPTLDPPLNYFDTLGLNESAKLVVALKEWVSLDNKLDDLVEQVKQASERAKLEAELLGASSSILETNFEDFSPDLTPTSVVQVDKDGAVLTSKQIEPASSGASKNTIFFWVKKKSGDVETVSTNRLEEGTALEVLSGTDLLPGTEVSFELDLDFDMPTSSYVSATAKVGPEKKQVTRTEDMLNSDGTIKLEYVDRLPIKIVSNGKTVQWLHIPGWIKWEDGDMTGPERFYHIVDEKKDFKTGEVIISPGNAQCEAMKNLSLRSAFVQAYNEGILAGKPKGWLKVGSKVTNKTEGNFVYAGNGTIRANVLKEHRVVAGKHVTVPVALGIFQNGTLLGTQARPEITSDITVPEAYNNRVLAMLPMANGKYTPVPLSGHKLSDNMKGEKDESTDAWQTFNRVVELFLGRQGTEAERTLLSTELGYDVSTRDGFRKFVTQYFTHFSQEGDASPGVKIKTVKNLQTGKVDVHIETYTDEANRVVVLELDPDGNLSRESKAEVAHLFSNRYRAISLTKPQHDIKGLNYQGEFKEPLFVKGQWTVKTHPSYNDYITKYLISPVAFVDFIDGGVERTDSSGTKYKDFFYGVNPIVTYDTTPFNNLQTPLNAAIAVGTVQPTGGSVLSQMFEETPETIEKEKLEALKKEFKNVELVRTTVESNSDVVIQRQGVEWKGVWYGPQKVPVADIIKSYKGIVALYDTKLKALQPSTSDDSVLSQMFADELPSTPVSIMTVGVTEGIQTNLANLEKLFNFTPESERNGKSTFEVYEQMKALKITHIAPGYNPFKTC